MSVRKLLLAGVAAGLAAVTGLAGVAAAQPERGHASQPASHDSHDKGPVTYLAAGLLGRNEIPVPGGPAVDDPDGRATAVVRIAGNRVSYAVRWQGTAPPIALHIHAGAKDVNGGIRIGFFDHTLPAGARAVSGTVTVDDAALLEALRTNPRDFYVNLHTGEFPGGAVRSQLHALNRSVDLDGVLNGTTTADLRASADGNQEVPRGDRDGRANWLVKAQGTELSYAATWERLAAVTGGRIHAGPRGANGPVVADLFADAAGLPASITGIAGTATVDADVVQRLNANHRAFYADLRTTEHAAGAVRGQLSRTTESQPHAVNAEVLSGTQIYSCQPQPDGSNGFGQFGVAAVLRGDILHSFARPVAGPPQWIAPDGSAVTGAVVTRSPNGAGNIAELVLDATQAGERTGLLAGTSQILRLNTLGGTAPTGDCEPGTIATSSYRADYLFLG